ncbi:PAS domain S-box-containing protein [Breznakibacter xylanolyticus]|uniref:PAS domain S-box-containing protein n=1 Tax=Breznakibacter xylanolyticus TaxID=990 RepID=A0A2W7NA16_9BACT|nr:PAS domain-containing protein [Breznakibacter xylanolyticus]PZX16850.1 PAS domain S-box-containing protein [Breznakibacter xylanolyticus]
MGIILFLSGILTSSPILYYYAKKKCKETNAKAVLLQQQIELLEEQLTQKNSNSRYSQDELERLSIVAQQTDNAIMIMDREGNIEWFNDGFTRMYEYTFEEFIRIRGNNILKTSFNPAIKERLERCIRTKQPVFYEAINVMPSGKEIWTHTSLTPILDENGEVIHLATIDTDINKRKEAGDALVKCVNALSIRINELASQQQDLLRFVQHFIDRVHDSNMKISETDTIVHFIREMSDRIRIMGINASIEAHSAGMQGSGFRVISGEIVKMSDETKRQAQKIYAVVESIKGSSDVLAQQKMEVERVTQKYMTLIDYLKKEVKQVEIVAERLN